MFENPVSLAFIVVPLILGIGALLIAAILVIAACIAAGREDERRGWK
jgi:hypothetical protein